MVMWISVSGTREAIDRSLMRLAAWTKPNDRVLKDFAGHGDLDRTYNDEGWIPVDAVGGKHRSCLEDNLVGKSEQNKKEPRKNLNIDSVRLWFEFQRSPFIKPSRFTARNPNFLRHLS